MYYQFAKPLLVVGALVIGWNTPAFGMSFLGAAESLADKAERILDAGKDRAREEFGGLVIVQCKRDADERKEMADAINANLESQGRPERVTALDCDGDGQPDF